MSSARKIVVPQNKDLPPIYDGEGIGGIPALGFNRTGLVIPNEAQEFFPADFTIGFVYQAHAGNGCLLDGRKQTEEDDGFYIGLAEDGTLEVKGNKAEVKLAAKLNEAHLVVITGQLTTEGYLLVTLWLDGTMPDKNLPILNFRRCPAHLTIGKAGRANKVFAKIGEVVIYTKPCPPGSDSGWRSSWPKMAG